MNDGTICPRCRGPTIFESKSCRSFLNHIRTCNIDKSDCQSSLLTKLQECPFTCPICKSPTIYKSNTCQSFLNHARVCGVIELKKNIPPPVVLSNDEEFFLSCNRSHAYEGTSFLQSGRQIDKWFANADFHASQQSDYEHSFSTDNDFNADEDCLVPIDISYKPTMQPHALHYFPPLVWVM